MGVINNLGYVSKATYFPCATPSPILAIQAAGDALFPVLASALQFGCLDIIKMRAGMSPWHARKLRALISNPVTAVETDRLNKIYKYAVPVEKLLFFWFVVDLTTEFFARWQSNMFQLGACGQAARQCTKNGTLAAWVCSAPDSWAYIAYELTSMSGTCGPGLGVNFFVPPHAYFSTYFSLTARSIIHNQPVQSLSTRLNCIAGGSFAYQRDPTFAPWIGNDVTATSLVDSQNNSAQGRLFQWEASADVEAVGVSGSVHYQVSDMPVFDKSIIPVNCFGAPTPQHAFS